MLWVIETDDKYDIISATQTDKHTHTDTMTFQCRPPSSLVSTEAPPQSCVRPLSTYLRQPEGHRSL